jgi:hypothetical protein
MDENKETNRIEQKDGDKKPQGFHMGLHLE